MKVIFFIQGFTVAASRYRVLQYIPYLKKDGIEVDVREYPRTLFEWGKVIKLAQTWDAFFFQRKRVPLPILLLLKAKNMKIVYDFDDAVMFRNSLGKNPYSLRRKLSFKRMVRFSDLIIAGNSFLKKEAEKYSRNVHILPTPVDMERYRERPQREKETVSLGWIGDHGSIHYLRAFKDVFEEIGKRFDYVELIIICDTFMDSEHIKIKKIRWNYETEIDDLHKIDIGVMPLYFDLWSEGKCGFKILQYSGVGIPCVCTPVGINKDIVKDGVNGFFASSKEEWIEKLSILIKDKNLRQEMGEKARERVIEAYSLQVSAPKLSKWLKSLKGQ